MEKHQKYVLIFNITFFLGYLFRFLIAGWYMVLFFIPEYLFRSFYYFSGTTLFDNELNKNSIQLNVALQVSYLLTSFLSYDGSDENTYTFAGLWTHPPETILFLWVLFAFITFILIMISIFYHLKQNKNSVIIRDKLPKFFVGCIVIPALAMLLASFFV